MRFGQRVTTVLAWLYPVSLVATVAALRLVGERWWVTGVTLYLPRILFALPLPFVVLLLSWLGPRRLLWTQLAAALLVLFPLMGLAVPWPTLRTRGAPVLRVLSYNIDSGINGFEEIGKEIDRYSPDIVFLQEIGSVEAVGALMRARYPTVDIRNQFLVASKYPIVSKWDPDKLENQGRLRSPRFVQQVLDTPLGPIAFYNVHPISPREAFYELRGTESRRDFLTRGILHDIVSPGSNAIFEANAGLRALQVHTFAESARRETLPVVVAGDTNSPGLSFVIHRDLSQLQDGFAAAGVGFGYTFPAGRRPPWMRIDRIFAGEQLRVVGFEVGASLASDHRCVVADIQLRSP
jgi:vancomycin resistance protein VanJ